MMRRHACLSILAVLSLFALAACDPVIIAGGDGGGGGAASCATTATDTTCTTILGTSTDTGGGTTTHTGTWTFTGTDGGCKAMGGVCAQYVPDVGCPDGVWLDPASMICSGGEANCCLPVVCTPGADQTCNHDPSMNSYAGHCTDDGICTCYAGHQKVEDGKCQ